MNAVQAIRSSRPVDLYCDHKSRLTQAEFVQRCAGQVIWHSVDLGDLFIEGERKSSAVLAVEAQLIDWPDLRGKSVLDIGAFGGWYSFEAERRGAASVTAIDYYSWVVDWPKLFRWVAQERAAGRTPNGYTPPAEMIDEVGQPGRRVFDVTREALGSKVRPILTKAEDFESDPFDVVLYLGVLYHCENPLASLRKVASLTKDHLIVETLGLHVPDREDRPLWEFYGDGRVNQDPSTWWAPNENGLKDMLQSAGFRRVEIKAGADRLSQAARRQPTNIRIWAHAWK